MTNSTTDRRRRGGACPGVALLIVVVLLAWPAAAVVHATAGEPPAEDDPSHVIEMREALALPGGVRAGGRSPLQQDLIEHQRVLGNWAPPEKGDTVESLDGETLTWTTMAANDDGWIADSSLRGGYVSWTVELDEPRIMLLEAAGHSVVHVNGDPRGGDPYGYGWALLPVALHEGGNELLFAVTRGRVRAKLIEPNASAVFRPSEATLPDLIIGEPWAVRGSVLVVNAEREAREAGELAIRAGGGELPVYETSLPRIESLTQRKVAFTFGGAVDPEVDRIDLPIALIERGPDGVDRVLDRTTLRVRVRQPHEKHKRTFISDIDGSVQYYAVTPPPQGEAGGALVLTLHGASVEAMNQANAYGRKDWAHIVAPTNRRPFGFDWEDWGRIDAMEVLSESMERFEPDPRQIYLTGHSMGGHGTWHLGATFPCQWAAIGPSAGWISFRSYGGAPDWTGTPLADVHLPSDTLALLENYLRHGVYILHGEQDDNVPPTESREMFDRLSEFHPDVVYHEEPSAGHWWGSRCVDWPPMFEFFQERRRPAPEDVDALGFVTANPGISDRCHWLRIVQQARPYELSRMETQLDRRAGSLVVTTSNVIRFAVDLSHLSERGESSAVALSATIDGSDPIAIEPGVDDSVVLNDLHFVRDGETWSLTTEAVPPDEKRPERAGPFKQAFDNQMVFVYATQGAPEENAWSKAKAIYDAETWWYRGNGSVDVLPDVRFVERAKEMAGRNVILYGHRGMNAGWPTVLAEDEGLLVDRGLVRTSAGGQSPIERNGLAVLAVRPRSDSVEALVGVVAGTDVVGMRLTNRLPYFVSGVAYPDLTILDSTFLSDDAHGLRRFTTYLNNWRDGITSENPP